MNACSGSTSKWPGKEEFLANGHDLRMQRDEVSKKINAVRVPNSRILGQVMRCKTASKRPRFYLTENKLNNMRMVKN